MSELETKTVIVYAEVMAFTKDVVLAYESEEEFICMLKNQNYNKDNAPNVIAKFYAPTFTEAMNDAKLFIKAKQV